MSMKTINAIKLSNMEEELEDIVQKIKRAIEVMNNPREFGKRVSKQKEKEVVVLIARRKKLENDIAENLLLDK